MPIQIYKDDYEVFTSLSDEDWELSMQLYNLEEWLNTKGKKLSPGTYIADIGFRVGEDATGGGGTLSAKSMKIMGDIGMEVHFSEYP